MQILRRASEVMAFQHPRASIVRLLSQRLSELTAEGDDFEEIAFFIVLDRGDGLPDDEPAMPFPWMTDCGRPLWEVIEAHPDCYELVFVLDDSGYGAIVIAPRGDADPAVLELCRRHAHTP